MHGRKSVGSVGAVADLIGHLLKRRPWQSFLILLALLVASLAESVGFVSFLPLLSIAQASGVAERPGSAAAGMVASLFSVVGLPQTLGAILALIVVAIALKAIAGSAAQLFLAYCVGGILTDMRLDLMRAIGRARWAYFVDQSPGELATMIGSESQRAANGLINSVMVVNTLLQASFYLGVAFLVEWKFTLASVAAGILIAAVLQRFVGIAHRTGRQQTELVRSMLSNMVDGLQGYKALKAMGREDALVSLIAHDANRYLRVYLTHRGSAVALQYLPEALAVAMVGALVYGALAIQNIEFGEIFVIAALGYRGVGRMSELQKVLQSTVANHGAYVFIQDVFHRADSMREEFAGTEPPTFERDLRFEDVSFAHGDLPVLRSVSLTVPASGVTALIGPSGAGKTTIIDLMLGLRKPNSGAIKIDGREVGEMDIRAWRHQIGYVPQEVQLFNRTLFENIALDEPDVTRADAEAALRQAGGGELLELLPNGINSQVGQAGQRLSGGQRQRIAIARALVHRPRLLLLDEATSALDPATEQRICATLKEISGTVAVLAISHQPGIRMIADRIYQIEAGGVASLSEPAAPALAALTDGVPEAHP